MYEFSRAALFCAPLDLVFLVAIFLGSGLKGEAAITRTRMYSRTARTLWVLGLEALIVLDVLPALMMPLGEIKALTVGLELGFWSLFVGAGLAAAAISPVVVIVQLVRIAQRPARACTVLGGPGISIGR